VHLPDSQYDFLSDINPPFKVPERDAPEGGGKTDCHALAGGYLIPHCSFLCGIFSSGTSSASAMSTAIFRRGIRSPDIYIDIVDGLNPHSSNFFLFLLMRFLK